MELDEYYSIDSILAEQSVKFFFYMTKKQTIELNIFSLKIRKYHVQHFMNTAPMSI